MRLDKHFFGGIFLSFLFSVCFLAIFWDRLINHDTAYYLLAVREWLGGAKLYVDVVEINPPLNFYLTLPVIFFATLTGVSDTNAQYSIVALFLFISLSWSWTILSKIDGIFWFRRYLLLFGLGLSLVIPALEMIGQREQFLVIFVLPWLLGYLEKQPASKIQIASRSGFASLGICLKPFFLLLPLAFTFWAIVQKKSLSPIFSISNVTIFIVGFVYLFIAWVLHPEYFYEIIPLAFAVYRDWSFGAAEVWNALTPVILILFFLTLLQYLIQKRNVFGFSLFVYAVIASLSIYLLQWKGWSYQAIPYLTFVSIACFWILINTRVLVADVFYSILTLLILFGIFIGKGFYSSSIAQTLVPVIENAASDPKIMVFSTHISVGTPIAISVHAKWLSRYPALWPVPGAINTLLGLDCSIRPGKCAEAKNILNDTRNNIIEDILKNEPNILIFDNKSGYFKQKNFLWHDFMGEASEFSVILSNYQIFFTSQRFTLWLKKE